MWCTACRQDVPGLVDGVDAGYTCARCGGTLLNDSGIDLSGDLPVRPSAGREPIEEYRDELREKIPFELAADPQPEPTRISSLRWDAANWELNEKLRHVERLTSTSARPTPASPMSRYDAGSFGFGRPHFEIGEAAPPSYEPGRFEPYAPEGPFEPAPFHSPYAPPYQPLPASHPHAPHVPGGAPPAHNRTPAWVEAAASLASWLLLGLAVGAFCCGGFLAGWGAVGGRPQLEQLGMPIILGGMLAMVLGLLPQIFLRRVSERVAAAATADDHPGPAAASPRSPYGEAPAPHGEYARRAPSYAAAYRR